jgi:hypothetical protein
MDRLQASDYSKPIIHGELQIHFKPLSYRQLTENSIQQFEEQKVLNVLPDTEMSDSDKRQRLNQAVIRLTDLTITTLAQCISVIKTSDTMVSEPEYILEFLKNCEGSMFNQIRDYVIGLREQSDIQPLDLKCPNCQHQYQQTFQLDQSNFFGDAS